MNYPYLSNHRCSLRGGTFRVFAPLINRDEPNRLDLQSVRARNSHHKYRFLLMHVTRLCFVRYGYMYSVRCLRAGIEFVGTLTRNRVLLQGYTRTPGKGKKFAQNSLNWRLPVREAYRTHPGMQNSVPYRTQPYVVRAKLWRVSH